MKAFTLFLCVAAIMVVVDAGGWTIDKDCTGCQYRMNAKEQAEFIKLATAAMAQRGGYGAKMGFLRKSLDKNKLLNKKPGKKFWTCIYFGRMPWGYSTPKILKRITIEYKKTHHISCSYDIDD